MDLFYADSHCLKFKEGNKYSIFERGNTLNKAIITVLHGKKVRGIKNFISKVVDL
jgi:hypothetical protein